MADLKQVLSVSKDVPTVLVIPAFIWIVKLESSNAVRDVKIAQLQEQVTDLRQVNASIGTINVSVGSLQTKMGEVDKKVDKIYDALMGPR